jgi:hypothetical protein
VADDPDLIELIDADPTAFGLPAPSTEAEPHELRARSPLGGRRLLALALAAVTALLVAALFAWKPWVDDPLLALPDPPVTAAQLSSHLVLDLPVERVRATTLQDPGPEAGFTPPAGAVGHFLGGTGARLQTGDGNTVPWFGFFGRPAKSDDALFSQGVVVAGAPAEMSEETPGEVQLAWGPVDGFIFQAVGVHLDQAATLAIAEQLRIRGGQPVLLDRNAADGLHPIGSFGDYTAAATLVQFAQNNNRGTERVTGLYYGYPGQSVVSMEANRSVIDMLPFVLNSTAHEGTVHGGRALGFTKGAGPFGGFDTSMVFWWEGGRLILVAGGDDLDATFALAEGTRVATDDEWATVMAVD